MSKGDAGRGIVRYRGRSDITPLQGLYCCAKPIITLTTQELYQLFGAQIYNVVFYHLKNVEETEEVTQDVFVAAHFQREQFRGQAQWGTYLYRIAVNKCIDRLRARERRAKWLKWVPWQDTRAVQSIPADSEAVSPTEHKLQWLLNEMDELPISQRTAFLLMKMEGKTQREVAEIMDLSPKAVESLVQRAMASLKKKSQFFEGLDQ